MNRVWKQNPNMLIPYYLMFSYLYYEKNISLIEDGEFDFAVLNAKGFGGNNGTSLVASPSKTMQMLKSKHSKKDINTYLIKKSKIDDQLNLTKEEILKGDIKSRYIFGEDVIDGMHDFDIETDKIVNKLNKEVFDLNSTLPYKDYF